MPAQKPKIIVAVVTVESRDALGSKGGVRDPRRKAPLPALDTSGGTNGTHLHFRAVRRRGQDRNKADEAEKLEQALKIHRQLAASSEMGPYPKPTEFVEKPPLAEVFAKRPFMGC